MPKSAFSSKPKISSKKAPEPNQLLETIHKFATNTELKTKVKMSLPEPRNYFKIRDENF